jgi:hypothetical protein
VREAFPSQAKLTIVTAVIDKLRPREELARGELSSANSVDFIRSSSPETSTVPSSPTNYDLDEHLVSILVVLRTF